MSFAAKLLHGSKDPIYLVTGQDHTGNKAWYYMQVDNIKLGAFKKNLATGDLRLTDYGKILESGYGEAPPEDVVTRMKKTYNF